MTAQVRATRRGVLAAGGLTLVALGAPGLAGCGTSGSAPRSDGHVAGRLLPSRAPLPDPFRARLPIPKRLEPVRSEGDTDFYEVTQQQADVEILPGLQTRIWGYDGSFPGPTIESRRGRRVVVTHRNQLPVPTVVHLHGGTTAPEYDGYPTDLILPVDGWDGGGHHDVVRGEHGPPAEGERDYAYELDQRAATLWYHDHRLDFTGPSVWRGLAGFHLHRDDEEAALGLPDGDREIPLMITDRSFDKDGTLLYPALDPHLRSRPGVKEDYMEGVLGDVILVNGAPWPVHEVAATTYRLRILNASNSRRYRLGFEDDTPLVQVGSDQGLIERPVKHRRIDIAQAERFDVVVDLSDHAVGDELTLINELGEDGTDRVLRLRVTRRPEPDETPRPLPKRLSTVERLSEDDVVVKREFRLQRKEVDGQSMWTINDELFTPDKVLARPRHGTVERWTIRGTDAEHPFHIHLAPFQIIRRGDNVTTGPYDAGWKDTANLDEGYRLDFLIRFDGHRGKYVFHCHNLEHEDMMMMANFEVV